MSRPAPRLEVGTAATVDLSRVICHVRGSAAAAGPGPAFCAQTRGIPAQCVRRVTSAGDAVRSSPGEAETVDRLLRLARYGCRCSGEEGDEERGRARSWSSRQRWARFACACVGQESPCAAMAAVAYTGSNVSKRNKRGAYRFARIVLADDVGRPHSVDAGTETGRRSA